jgi:hypothetical protein
VHWIHLAQHRGPVAGCFVRGSGDLGYLKSDQLWTSEEVVCCLRTSLFCGVRYVNCTFLWIIYIYICL